MATSFANVLKTPCSAQTILAGATYTSEEQYLGADTYADQIWLGLDVSVFAAPGG